MCTSGEPNVTVEQPIVVAAAIVRDGHVLAARRLLPAELAGGWELPGGKVEPGEDERAALVRECDEELGVHVIVGDRLGASVPLPGGGELRGWVVRLAPGSSEPAAGADHDELRWLSAARLDDVEWLAADRPLVAALRGLLSGERLAGGNVGGAVRVGDTVRRPAGAWTPTVHALLAHLRAAGLPGVPEPHGIDELGREVLSYLPGETVGSGSAGSPPAWTLSDGVLAQAMEWLSAYHEAVRDFRPDNQVWRLRPGALAPDEIVCHNDVAPYNLVVDSSERLVGVVDWDVSGPGYPIDDVAFAAWNFVPLYDAAVSVSEVARKLELLASSYGGYSAGEVLRHVPIRMTAGFRRIRRGAALGDAGMRALVGSGRIDASEKMLAGLGDRLPGLLVVCG